MWLSGAGIRINKYEENGSTLSILHGTLKGTIIKSVQMRDLNNNGAVGALLGIIFSASSLAEAIAPCHFIDYIIDM